MSVLMRNDLSTYIFTRSSDATKTILLLLLQRWVFWQNLSHCEFSNFQYNTQSLDSL